MTIYINKQIEQHLTKVLKQKPKTADITALLNDGLIFRAGMQIMTEITSDISKSIIKRGEYK